MRSPFDLLPPPSLRPREGMSSNGSVGLSVFSACGVVDREAVGVSVVMAEVQNSSANFSATVRNEGMAGGHWVRQWMRQSC